jgi:hypothetical protein
VIQYGGITSPLPNLTNRTAMDCFTVNVQVEEHPLIDITFMTDEELAALLEVTVDQLLGE